MKLEEKVGVRYFQTDGNVRDEALIPLQLNGEAQVVNIFLIVYFTLLGGERLNCEKDMLVLGANELKEVDLAIDLPREVRLEENFALDDDNRGLY